MTTHDNANIKSVDKSTTDAIDQTQQPENAAALEGFLGLQRTFKTPNPKTLSPSAILQLQRTIGNRNTMQLLSRQQKQSTMLQTIGQSDPDNIHRTTDRIWNLTDVTDLPLPTAKEYLKTDFHSNWFLAKDYLVEGKWDSLKKSPQESSAKRAVHQGLMQRFLDLRSEECYGLLKHIRDEVLTEDPTLENLEPDDRLKFGAAGSETLTSDIDINLKGQGAMTAVSLFNSLFKTRLGWALEPGTVYDVNVYAPDHMTTKPFSKQETSQTLTMIPSQEIDLGNPESEMFQSFSGSQDVFSLVKVRTYMNLTEWEAYKRKILKRGDTDPEMSKRFTEAEEYFAEFERKIHQKIEEIETNASGAYTTMLETLERGKSVLGHKEHDAKKMMAANKIYEELIENEIKPLRAKIALLKGEPTKNAAELKELGLQLKKALSHSIIYANEAYLTQGAIHFAVIGQQIGGGMAKKKGLELNIELSDEEHMHSFREQVGDALKVMAEYPDAPVWKAIYKAGKYIDRMIKSAQPLIGDDTIHHFHVFKKAGELAMDLKGSGSDAQTQERALTPLVAALPAQNGAGLRMLLTELGVDVEGSYNKKKHGERTETVQSTSPEYDETGQFRKDIAEEVEKLKTRETKVSSLVDQFQSYINGSDE